jgi:GH18 family chitinase
MPKHLAVSTAMTEQRRALLVLAALTLVFAELRMSSVVAIRLPVYPRLVRATSVTAGTPHCQLAVMTAVLLHVVLGIMRLGMSSMTFDYHHPLTPYRNSRRAPCDKKLPQDLDTTGFTHLVLAFATIDPQTYKIREMHPDEETVYHDFTTRPDGLPKYLGVGGWEFSNPGPTRRTWSQMASTKENRHAFIKSLGRFLAKWEFRGVDIHWQWPGAESRGGNPAIDTQNLVSLMTELRQGLGNNYGISIALPAQYEYLKAMNPKAIETSVDWFNMLTYDLHGPWDADVPAFGNKIRPHTDLNEIDKALKLLWSSNINPGKVNLGIANYGRGYTVADKSCIHSGCPFTGASRPGECTLLAGILSRCEIQRRIKANNLTPTTISGGAGVKEITWDDQWIGYDDDETLQLKLQLANNRCLGGTALWALSYGACKKDPFEPPVPISASVSPSVSTQNPPSSGTSRVPPNVPSIPISQSRKPSISKSFVQVSSPQAPTVSSKIPMMTTSGNVVVPPSQHSTLPFTTSTQASSPQAPAASSKISTVPTSQNFGVPPLQSSSTSSKLLTTRPTLSPTVSKGLSASPSAVPSAAPGISQHPSFRSTTALPSGQNTILATSNFPTPAPWPTPVAPSSGIKPSSGLTSQTSRVSASTSRGLSGTEVFSIPSTALSGSITEVTSRPVSSPVLSLGPPSAVTSTLPPLSSGSGPRSSSLVGSIIRTSGTPGGSLPSSPSAPSRSKSAPLPIIPSRSELVPVQTNPSRTSSFLTSTGGSQQASVTLPSNSSSPVAGTSERPTTPLVPATSLPPAGTSRIPAISQISSRWSPSSSTTISTLPPLRPSGISSRAPSSSRASTTTNKVSAPPLNNPTALPSVTPGPPSSIPNRPTSTANNNSPAPTGGASKCVPQDCIKECIVQRLLSFIAVKRPICVCIPKTCHEDDNDDDHHHHHNDPDSDSDSDDEGNCGLLGCGKLRPSLPFSTEKTKLTMQTGCGWMGLPFGPGCGDSSLDLDMPMLGLGCGIFGCNGACHLFGGCHPPGLPKPSSPPLPGPMPPPPADCGLLGCGGYCNVKGGCKPCPPQICGGPQCTRLGGCGPSPGPMPSSVRPSGTPDPAKCEEAQKTTVTERFVVCTEGFEVKPTTIASINFTISEMITSTCLPLYEATLTACGIMGWTSTTTATSITSSTAPACTRAPLSLDDDEGDNPVDEEPAPACTRAPLLIDEDECDNAPACTQAPQLVDDDEGDDERKPKPSPTSTTISWEAPPSTLSEGPVKTTLQPPTITPPSQTSSSPPAAPTDCTWPWCNCCRATYADCVSLWCKPDGSNAAYCARICLTALCTFSKSSPEICRVGPCRLSACPKETPHNIEDGQPAAPFTTILRLPATTVTVTLMPSSSSTPLPSPTSLPPVTPITSVPQCTPGSISPTSQWQVQMEHIFDITGIQLKWDIYDHNGCHAGAGVGYKQLIDKAAGSGAGDMSADAIVAGPVSNMFIADPGSSIRSLSLPLSSSKPPAPHIKKQRRDSRQDINIEIASSNRPVQDSMSYKVHVRVLDPGSYSTRTVFTLQQSAANCPTECHPTFEIGDGTAKVPYYISNDCHSACSGRPAITNADVGCSDGANVLDRITLTTGKIAFRRQFWCWWRMPSLFA